MIDNLDSVQNASGRRRRRIPIRRRSLGAATTVTALPVKPSQVADPTRSYSAQADIRIQWVKKGGGAAALKMPFSLFGEADSRSKYTKFLQVVPNLDATYLYKGFYILPDANVDTITGGTTIGQSGDGVFIYVKAADGDWCAAVIHCNQVAYGTLLAATNSDRFVISALRYSVTNPAVLTQYSEQISYVYQSLFGKAVTDSLNPLSYKDPKQFQAGVIDIPLGSNGWNINKSSQFGGYIIPSQDMTWSIFIESETKLV